MARLTYVKVNDNTITIDLHNGYTVMAMSRWDPKSHGYTTTLYLKDNTIDTLQLILDAEKLEFHANYKTINSAILKYVSACLDEGFFEPYIEGYAFEQKCINSGYNLIEKERLSHAS